jgi:predicted ester cyclase
MSVEWNIAVVRRIIDGLNQWDPAIFNELFLKDAADRNPLAGQPPSVEGIKASHIIYKRAFPDSHLSVEDIVAQGDKVVVRWILRGTHSGDFLGVAPTGRRVRVSGMDMYRLSEGKVAEWWHAGNSEAIKQQLTDPENPPATEALYTLIKISQSPT